MKTKPITKSDPTHQVPTSAYGIEASVFLTGICLFLCQATSAVPLLSLQFGTNSISESQTKAATYATVSSDVLLTNDLVILIFNPTPDQVGVPGSVTIPAGSNTATMSIDAVNNGDTDGVRAITLTAAADGLAPATATLQITDDDTPSRRTIGGRLFGHLATNVYSVTSDLAVEAGRTLAVDPATTLAFDPGIALTNAGTLLAAGTPGAEISFTSSMPNPTNGSWKGITVTSSGAPETVLAYADIAYAQNGVMVIPSGSEPSFVLSNSSIRQCSVDGVQVRAGRLVAIDFPAVQVVNNRIYENGRHGVNIYAYAYACDWSRNGSSLVGNDIFQNASAGVNLNADASSSWGCVDKNGWVTRRSRISSLIANNTIHGNKYGIYGYAKKGYLADFGSLYPTIQNNLIVNNTLDGLWLDAGYGSKANAELYPTIVNNTIAWNGGAGLFHGTNVFVGFTFANNLVVQNRVGLSAASVFDSTNGVMSFNDIWGNFGSNWVNYPSVYGRAVTNNLNGDPSDSNMNICANPMFALGTQYHLEVVSPAIDAGTTNRAPDLDAEGQPRALFPDLGWCELVTPRLAPVLSPDRTGIQLSLAGGRGLRYRIETTTNLHDWSPAVTNLTMTARTVSAEIPPIPQGDSRRFYRAVLLP
jgi:hypothetical protein